MPRRVRLSAWSLLVLELLFSWIADAAQSPPNGSEGDWAQHGRDASEQRFSPLHEINSGNAAHLGLLWWLDLPGESALAATPLAVEGKVYFSGSLGTVYAVDAASGRLIWNYDPQSFKAAPHSLRMLYNTNRGLAYWRHKIYLASKDGRLIALDCGSGKMLWTTRFLRADGRAVSTGAPRVFNGKVIIGNSGAEYGARGSVTTFDADTGKVLWRFFTVPGNPHTDQDETTQLAAQTWVGEWWKGGGGGTPWSGITYDAAFDQVLIGTGNGGPWNGKSRCPQGQDNLFLSSVVALDSNTGKYKWHYQYNPCEVWDWKAVADIVLAQLEINGKLRNVLMQAPSNGFFYVIDRADGKLISAEKLGKVTWADRIDLSSGRPVERPNIRYQNGPSILYPGSAGAHNWQPTSYNPMTGLLYIPYMQNGMKLTPSAASEADASSEPMKLKLRVGVDSESYFDSADPQDGKGSLLAWDPVTQKLRWRVDYPTFWNTGTLTTAGNLVFQGTNDGHLYGYDAADGKRVWTFNTLLGLLAPPITYLVNGRQYVSILVGYGAAGGEGGKGLQQGWKYGRQPRRLLTFALNAKAVLPKTPPAEFGIAPLDDPNMRLDPKVVESGNALYHQTCTVCHGGEVQASGGAPDLRESAIAFNRDTFHKVLQQGLLLPRGMPQFDDLNDRDREAIFQYIRSEARKCTQSPHESPKQTELPVKLPPISGFSGRQC